MAKIHPTSIIGKKAEIDETVEIGPFCIVEDGVRIGRGTRLLSNVTILSGALIGENNTFFPGSIIAAVPQDLKFSGEATQLLIGNNNTIRECVTMNRGTEATGKTVVGNKNFFMAYSHVAHDCVIGDNCILANSVALGGHVFLGNYVILGGLAGVHQFVRIGDHTMIGASSMVVKDVIPYALFSGNPLDYQGLNMVGLRRRGFTDEKIDILKECFKYLFKSGLNVSQAFEKIRSGVEIVPEVENLLAFISASKRGIAK